MKKKIFLTLGFFIIRFTVSPFSLWALPDLFESQTLFYNINFKDESKPIEAGLKFNFAPAELRFSTDGSCHNFGISLFSDKYLENFPIILKIGNLSIGGLLSKLNSPTPDNSTTGFSSCYSSPISITANLPSFGSFSKPFSTFVQLGYKNDKSFIREVILNGAYTPTSRESCFSTKILLSIFDNFLLTQSLAVNFFKIKEKTFSSWYSPLPYYTNENLFSGAGEISLSLFELVHSCLSIFLYETPFGKLKPIFNFDNKLEINDFALGISCFLNKNNDITLKDGSTSDPIFSLKTNIQYKFFIPTSNIPKSSHSFVKTGLTTSFLYPLLLKNENEHVSQIRFGLSSLISLPLIKKSISNKTFYKDDIKNDDFFMTFAFDATLTMELINNILDTENMKYNFTLGKSKPLITYFSTKLINKWYFDYISPELILSSRFYFSSSELSSHLHLLGINLNLEDSLFSVESSYSFNCKNHKLYNKKLNFGVNINYNCKKIIFQMKINGEFCI